MKKFILKQVLTASLLISTSALVSCTPDNHKAHTDFVHQMVKDMTGFVDFTIKWTENFFDTNNHTSFATFTHELSHATEEFHRIVVKPLSQHLSHSPYHSALSIGKEIACTLHDQADHVCCVLKKNVRNRNATMVGLALRKTEEYTRTKMIKQLQELFNKFVLELRQVDPEIATYAHQMGRDVIESRKFQHDMSMSEQYHALKHRVRC